MDDLMDDLTVNTAANLVMAIELLKAVPKLSIIKNGNEILLGDIPELTPSFDFMDKFNESVEKSK